MNHMNCWGHLNIDQYCTWNHSICMVRILRFFPFHIEVCWCCNIPFHWCSERIFHAHMLLKMLMRLEYIHSRHFESFDIEYTYLINTSLMKCMAYLFFIMEHIWIRYLPNLYNILQNHNPMMLELICRLLQLLRWLNNLIHLGHLHVHFICKLCCTSLPYNLQNSWSSPNNNPYSSMNML